MPTRATLAFAVVLLVVPLVLESVTITPWAPLAPHARLVLLVMQLRYKVAPLSAKIFATVILVQSAVLPLATPFPPVMNAVTTTTKPPDAPLA
jgi:hypothetical protein